MCKSFQHLFNNRKKTVLHSVFNEGARNFHIHLIFKGQRIIRVKKKKKSKKKKKQFNLANHTKIQMSPERYFYFG